MCYRLWKFNSASWWRKVKKMTVKKVLKEYFCANEIFEED